MIGPGSDKNVFLVKKMMEIMSIKGGPTLNGKFHFKFPFCFSDFLPNFDRFTSYSFKHYLYFEY